MGEDFTSKLESKKLVRQDIASFPSERLLKRPLANYIGGGRNLAFGEPTFVIEGKPIIVDNETFQYSYKRGHCGHEWSEKHTEEHELGREK